VYTRGLVIQAPRIASIYDTGVQESDFHAYKLRTGRPDAGQQGGASARTSDDLKEQQKKKPGFQAGAAVCSQPESGQAPPVGEEPKPKTSEFQPLDGSFHHNSTTEQLFELLDQLKGELLRRTNDG
tara:strand:+ start:182 stop:559 length:378 start_codon:yes stop_codon:yes gene_type:complete